MIPPIGELKPAEIAAATPHPINISFDKSPPIFLLIKFPIVPPRCTKGPYWPTDAPPLAEINAENVERSPVFTSNSEVGLWALKITSAGPWYLEMFSNLFTKIIVMAAKARKTSGIGLKQYPDNSNKQELLINLKFEIFFTPSTKPTEQIETMLPVRVPKIITWKIILNIFKTKFHKNYNAMIFYIMFSNCQIWMTVQQLTLQANQLQVLLLCSTL